MHISVASGIFPTKILHPPLFKGPCPTRGSPLNEKINPPFYTTFKNCQCPFLGRLELVPSSPAQSRPVQSRPIQSRPIQSSLVQSSLVQSSLVQSSLVESSRLTQVWSFKVSLKLRKLRSWMLRSMHQVVHYSNYQRSQRIR